MSLSVYVACAGSNEIAVFGLDARTGKLDAVERFAVDEGITPLAIHPGRPILYAGFRGERPKLASFAVDPENGRLTNLANSPLTEPPMQLTCDRTGAYLLSASYAGATLTVTAIDADGGIASEPAQHVGTPPLAHGSAIDPTNRYVFVTSLGRDMILQYHFNPQTGHLTPNAVPHVALPPRCGPRHLAFAPRASVLYANGELDGSVTSFALDTSTGRLRPLHNASMMSGSDGDVEPWAAELAVRADGRFLYASERRTSTLAVFALDGERGTLDRRAIIASEEQPRAFAIDPHGRWLIVAGERSNHLTVYQIDAETGGLAPCGRVAVGAKPVWVTL